MTRDKVTILGATYQIKEVDWAADELLKACGWAGYCNETSKLIVYARPSTLPDKEMMTADELALELKQTLRHEIIHAFLSESGLSGCSSPAEVWATNEEMVDYFAIQLPKIITVCQELDIL